MLNFGRFGSVIKKPKLNGLTVFCRPLVNSPVASVTCTGILAMLVISVHIPLI